MRVIRGPCSMDITRKNDSSATKTHLTTANKQPVCDQTQQPGETLPTGVAGGAASNKTADTYTTATTEKKADLHIDKSNDQTTTTDYEDPIEIVYTWSTLKSWFNYS